MKRTGGAVWLAAVLIVVALSFKSLLLTPPPVPRTVTADAFDADRARARLTDILGSGAAHPVDSAANDAVRDRIVAALRFEGLKPRVTDGVACNGRGGTRAVSCARVRNIVAEIGPATGPVLALVAHYDSTPTGPGAADDGIGYATLIEVAHLLRDTSPKQGIVLLLTDGEEAGLLGARAFVDRDPAARRVTHLVNLEARGVSGPAFMFETSRPNAQPIAAFQATAKRPVANSLSTDFYRLIPNSTDVAVFEAKPWSILNFAIIGNETRYHAPGDIPAALDPRSLNHMGTQVLVLTRSWAAGTQYPAEGARIYADVLTMDLIVMPLIVGLVALALLLVGCAWVSWRGGATGRGLAVPATAVAAALALGFVGDRIARAILTGEYWRGHPHAPALAVDIGAVGAALVALAWIGARLDQRQARVGAWLFLLLLGAIATAVAPGASIFFLIPPAIALAGIAFATRWPAVERVASGVAALLLFVTFAQLIAEVELLLVSGPIWVTAALTAVATLPLLIEVRADHRPSPLLASVLAGIALIAGWTAVLLTPRATDDRKARFVVEHIADLNSGRARWGVATDGAELPAAFERFGPWTRAELPYSNRKRWVTAAPMLPSPPLDAACTRVAGYRTSFRIIAPGATNVLLQFPRDSGLREIGLAGAVRPVTAPEGDAPYALRCTGRSCDGVTVVVGRRSMVPLIVTMTAMYPGLPDAAKPLLAVRPANAAPQYSPDARYVIRRVRL